MAQRISALETANEIRFKRAQLKRDIKAGRVDLYSLVENPPEWLNTMKVIDLLLALPRIGRVKAGKYMTSHQMYHSKTVGGMSERQRKELLRYLK